MSYQAIARKWRPATFEEIAGQQHVTRTLQNAIRRGRIHHAYLFTGARGVGKTTAARALARCLNCLEGPAPTPCGACASCEEVLRGVSPDVVEIDGASNNSVEAVRELREAVGFLPVRSRYRVYIVDEVHMLSTAAFNALLKTLEEPPEHVVFVFATTEPQKIPETVLSRVQRFDFKRIGLGVVVDRLRQICEAEGVAISEAGLRMIARAGEGSMRDAQSHLDKVIAFSEPIDGEMRVPDEQVAEILGLVDRGLLREMLEGVLRGEPHRCLAAIRSVYELGYELSQFTGDLLDLVRNATLVVLSPESRRFLDLPAEEIAWLEEACAGRRPGQFVRLFRLVMELHEEVARSDRPRLVLEMGVAGLMRTGPSAPVDRLLERIDELERRLRDRGASPPVGAGPDQGTSGAAAPPAGRPVPPPAPASSRGAGLAQPRRPSPAAAAERPEPRRPSPEAAAEPAQAWPALLEALRGRRRVGARTLERQAVLLGYEDGCLRLGFRRSQWRDAARRLLEEQRPLVERYFPGLRRLDLALLDGEAVRTPAEEAEADRARRAEELRRRAEADPVIRYARERLGARIVGVEAFRAER